jgi:beta-glucosidase
MMHHKGGRRNQGAGISGGIVRINRNGCFAASVKSNTVSDVAPHPALPNLNQFYWKPEMTILLLLIACLGPLPEIHVEKAMNAKSTPGTLHAGPVFQNPSEPRSLALQLATEPHGITPVSSKQESQQKSVPLSLKPEPRPDDWWTKRHAEKKAAIAATPNTDVMLLGDSITHSWENNEDVWNEVLGGMSFFNLGFSGDRTEHVIWRLQNGAVDGLHPRVVMLMIGTNNTGHRVDSPADIAAGIEGVIKELRKRLPDSKILLLGIFPRGKTADARDRINNIETNKLISTFADNKSVYYLDIGKAFFSENGELTNGVGDDFLHLNAAGYRIWAMQVKPKLDELLK